MTRACSSVEWLIQLVYLSIRARSMCNSTAGPISQTVWINNSHCVWDLLCALLVWTFACKGSSIKLLVHHTCGSTHCCCMLVLSIPVNQTIIWINNNNNNNCCCCVKICCALIVNKLLYVGVNSFQAIRVLEVRDAVFFTNKKHVLINSKSSNYFEYQNGHLYQSKLTQPSTIRGIELLSVCSNQLEVTTDPIWPHYITS
jgi:hypothetical protein